jgi:Protein of unknown function with PCYCGC motif
MRKTLSYAILLTISFTNLSWADPLQQSVGNEKTTPPAAEAAQLPTPLPADMFQGRVREAYKVAAEIPEILAGVSCYCGCSKSQGHRHLLDCFASDHGAGCAHCVDEALDAHALFMTGASLEEVQQFIDHKYGPKH